MTIYICILMWLGGQYSYFSLHEIIASQFQNDISLERIERIQLLSPAKGQIESILSCLRICICRSFGFGLRGNKVDGKKDEIYSVTWATRPGPGLAPTEEGPRPLPTTYEKQRERVDKKKR